MTFAQELVKKREQLDSLREKVVMKTQLVAGINMADMLNRQLQALGWCLVTHVNFIVSNNNIVYHIEALNN